MKTLKHPRINSLATTISHWQPFQKSFTQKLSKTPCNRALTNFC